MNAGAASPPGLKNQMLTSTAGLCALGVLAALATKVWDVPHAEESSGHAVFGLGLLLVGGMAFGHLAALVRLPRLTGYLAAGVVAGPDVTGLLSEGVVGRLDIVNALALALIALQAGAEFTLESLRGGLRSLWWATVMQMGVLFPGLIVAFVVARPFMPFAADVELPVLVAGGLLWAAIGLSKSPAATLAVVGEENAKGPVSDYSLRMVVAFDILVLVVFAVCVVVATTLVEPGASLELHALSVLGEELVASVAAGTTLGLLVAAWLWAVKEERLLFVVCLAYGLTAFCRYFHYDTLLVFVILGFVTQNFTKQGPHLVEVTERLSGVVMVIFFATAGAHLDLDALRESWVAALGLTLIRALLTYIACRLGSRMAKDPVEVSRYGHTSLMAQAGVTLGLIPLMADRLPGTFGVGIASLGIAVVGINQVLGPVFFKWALSRAKELGKGDHGSGSASDPEADTDPPALTAGTPAPEPEGAV